MAPPDGETVDAAGIAAMASLAGLNLDEARAAALLPMVLGMALAGQRLAELRMQDVPAGPRGQTAADALPGAAT